MEIEYHYFSWNFLSAPNLFNTQKSKSGLLFRIDKKYFLSYCPWEQFGDESLDEVLNSIRAKKKKPIWFENQLALSKIAENIVDRPFKNHDLNEGNSSVVKIKADSDFDLLIKKIDKSVSKGQRVRIDFNNLLNKEDFEAFEKKMPSNLIDKIDYIEDPYPVEKDESYNTDISIACDRNPRVTDIAIYKPAVDEIVETKKRIIYSSYMGHDLERYYCYIDLMLNGDLNEWHGIDTPSLYKEQKKIFLKEGDYCRVNRKEVETLFTEMENIQWTSI